MLSNKRLAAFLFAVFSLFPWSIVSAERVLIPAAPKLAVKAYLLMDADTGEVIIEQNADEALPPASLTKMMTSYIVSEEISAGRLSEDTMVFVSDDAWKRGGTSSGSSTMFLKPRTEVRVIDLLKGVIIQSGNDASIALAQHIAGSEPAFADVMNQQAKMLGMTHTNFENATGWPEEGHMTTVGDLALLAQALINDHPEHYALYAEKYYKYNGINQPNRNRLLFTDSKVDGVKTGHTNAAGYCLVASSKRQDMRLISVVMGARSESARASESQKLLAYGFRYYQTHKLYSVGDTLTKTRVWKGVEQEIALTIGSDILATIPRGSHKSVKAESHIEGVVEAPITKGQKIGTLQIMLDDKLIQQTDLVASTDIDQAGFVSRLIDSVILAFQSSTESKGEEE